MTQLNFGTVPGLSKTEQISLLALSDVFNAHQSSNHTKERYYEGHITLNDVNLGIALPQGLKRLEVAAAGDKKRWMYWRQEVCSTALWGGITKP